jgi:DNA-binding transcriptional MerR regulator
VGAKKQPNILYGTTEAARLVGCSENCLRTYAKRGILNPIKTANNRSLFREPDIAAAKRQYRNK